GVISGVVKKKGKVYTASVFLRDGDDGGVVKQNSWTSKRGPGPLLRAVKKGMWSTFGPTLKSMQLPSAPKAAEPEGAPPPQASSASSAPEAPPPSARVPEEPVARNERRPTAETARR